jgi:hypothetical protein
MGDAVERDCASDLERMIDERLDSLEERHGVRQFGVDVEGRFVNPARVKMKEAGIANGAEGVDRQAARLGPGRDDDIAQSRRDRGFVTLPGAKAGEDEELRHCASSSGGPMQILGRAWPHGVQRGVDGRDVGFQAGAQKPGADALQLVQQFVREIASKNARQTAAA